MSNVIQLYDFSRDCSDSVTLAERALKRSRTFRKYEALLKQRSAMTEGEIKALAWTFNGARKSAVTNEERALLRQLLASREERPITADQSYFGIIWLERVAFKKNGEPRQTKTQPFGERELHIIRTFKRFTWVGYHNTQEDYGNYNGCKSMTPVWRCYGRDGSSFDYYVRAGGPGGSVDVVVVR